jgi:hypothetical protein
MPLTIGPGWSIGPGITVGIDGGAPPSRDPYWSSVSLLLPGNGTNGANNNTFLDSSSNNFGITKYGAPGQGSFSPFSSAAPYSTANGGSISFDTSSDYLSVNAQTALSFGTGDFTVECWVYPTAFNSAVSSVIEARSSQGAGSWLVGLRKISGVYKASFYTGTLYNGTTTIPLNTWTHIAWTRSSGTLRTFVNGTLDTTVSGITGAINAGAATQYIGDSWDPGSIMLGYMSNLRVVKGTAVYTAAFTPSTTPLTAIANTSLLLSGTNAGIIDNTMTTNLATLGNARISTTQSKWGGSSIFFDGSGDSLWYEKAPSFGTGNFTVEFWFSSTATNQYACFITTEDGSVGWTIMLNTAGVNTGTIGIWTTGLGAPVHLTSGTKYNNGNWYHLAWVRNGTNSSLYINGNSVASATVSASAGPGDSGIAKIGTSIYGGRDLTGYINDFRITKGVARYTSNFSVPTEAFPIQG